MKKNVASQLVAAQMVSSTDGSDITSGTVNVAVEIDGAAGTGGTATHIANGKWEYAPIQADTNGDHLTFQFTHTSGITQLIQIYTTFPQTGDSFDRLGAPAGASVSADIATVDGNVDSILVDTGTTLDNHLTDIKGTGFVKDTHSLTDIEAFVDILDDGTSGNAKIATDVAAALVDTNELQGDWTNGGRLDLIIDQILADTADIQPNYATSAELAKVPKSDGTTSWNATALAAINAEADTALTDYDPPTKAEMDTKIDALNNISVADVLTTQMTESYNTDGAAPTLAQALHLIIAYLMERSVSGTTVTAKQLDGSTTAATFTLDDGTSPTSVTRSG